MTTSAGNLRDLNQLCMHIHLIHNLEVHLIFPKVDSTLQKKVLHSFIIMDYSRNKIKHKKKLHFVTVHFVKNIANVLQRSYKYCITIPFKETYMD